MDTLDLLATRRSVPAAYLAAPGPSAAELDRLLSIAARVPDHGKLVPWRFVVFEGDAREAASGRLLALYRARNPDADVDTLGKETNRLAKAPLVVGVVARPAPHPKIPEWEQWLSAGAVCMTLVVAAHAMGYAANWLTGWPASDTEAKALFGVAADETIAGFVHIGTPAERPADRARPDMAAIVTRWSPA